MSEKGKVARAAGVVGGATLASRVLGFVRDAVAAWFFGAGLAADAFFVAFRIPNLLRRLFAEGSLTIAFVPVFSQRMEDHGQQDAFAMARAGFRLLALVLAGVTVLGIVFAPQVVSVVAPGFARNPDKLALTVTLTRITFPYVFFICLVALCMGVLNGLGHFFAPAAAPVLLNVAMIGAVFGLAPLFEQPVVGLAWGVIIGGALQLFFQFPYLVKKGVRLWEGKSLWHPALGRVMVLMGPAVFGAAVYQVNILVGTLLASLLPPGSVSYLYYADRLVQFPLGVFGIALATAVLPTLSRQAARKDFDELAQSFSFAVRLLFFITLPAAAGLIVLRTPIVALLFERGEFGPAATAATARALLYYAVGLWAFSAVRIVVAVYYSLQDTWTPVRSAMISMAANAVFALALMGPMLHAGLALATSLASGVNLLILVALLRRRLGGLRGGDILSSVFRSAAAAGAMGLAVHFAAGPVLGPDPSLPRLAGGVCGLVVLGMAVFAAGARALRLSEFDYALSMVRKRRRS
ncbi:MAG: murein biosynthesis integral membrane protein MurJ [Deltaproteobacteria bacterium]|nr:murein biosynthesis integral membrane protein MurJ [Deltaproteobacteria bacterium]